MSKGSIRKRKNPTPEKDIRKNEKEEGVTYISRSLNTSVRLNTAANFVF
jgi:hypothetical protein